MLQSKIVAPDKVAWFVEEIASKKEIFFDFFRGKIVPFLLSKNDTKGVLRPLEQF